MEAHLESAEGLVDETLEVRVGEGLAGPDLPGEVLRMSLGGVRLGLSWSPGKGERVEGVRWRGDPPP